MILLVVVSQTNINLLVCFLIVSLLPQLYDYRDITVILWSNQSQQVMTLVTWVVMCHAGTRYLVCNVINYPPYIIVMI